MALIPCSRCGTATSDVCSRCTTPRHAVLGARTLLLLAVYGLASLVLDLPIAWDAATIALAQVLP